MDTQAGKHLSLFDLCHSHRDKIGNWRPSVAKINLLSGIVLYVYLYAVSIKLWSALFNFAYPRTGICSLHCVAVFCHPRFTQVTFARYLPTNIFGIRISFYMNCICSRCELTVNYRSIIRMQTASLLCAIAIASRRVDEKFVDLTTNDKFRLARSYGLLISQLDVIGIFTKFTLRDKVSRLPPWISTICMMRETPFQLGVSHLSIIVTANRFRLLHFRFRRERNCPLRPLWSIGIYLFPEWISRIVKRHLFDASVSFRNEAIHMTYLLARSIDLNKLRDTEQFQNGLL